MAARAKRPVLRVPENRLGRDFVVGDIHACYDLVVQAMKQVGFDMRRDRLFSVGDLVDRGPEPHRVVKFLAQPWVFAVRGNHEDMFLEIYQDGEPRPGVLEFVTSRNGMGWWMQADEQLRRDVLAAAAELPIAIEIETPRGTVGLVHADVPAGMGWQAFLAALEAGDEDVMEVALWGRDRLHQRDLSGVPGVGRLFVGHTPMRHLTKLGNVYAVDTAAVYGMLAVDHGALTFAQITCRTNMFTTVGSMRRPDDLVVALMDQHPTAEPFSGLAPR